MFQYQPSHVKGCTGYQAASGRLSPTIARHRWHSRTMHAWSAAATRASASSASSTAHWESTEALALGLIIQESFQRSTQTPLLEVSDLTALAKQLWQAPLAVAVSSSTEPLTPGSCMYANQAALTALSFKWEDLAGAAAARVAAQHQEGGSSTQQAWSYTLDHSSQLQLQSGASITVEQLLQCPVRSPSGSSIGTALVFDLWSHADGRLGRAGFTPVHPDDLPTGQDVAGAADAVRQQADHVRELKSAQGLGNKHPDVQAAVAELQSRKAQLAAMEHLQAASNRQSTEMQALLARIQLAQQKKKQEAQQMASPATAL